MTLEELNKKVNELTLVIQTLEEKVKDLEDGNFGTGIYLEGCAEADAEYISTKPEKKVGE